jgi:hypothetical protein
MAAWMRAENGADGGTGFRPTPGVLITARLIIRVALLLLLLLLLLAALLFSAAAGYPGLRALRGLVEALSGSRHILAHAGHGVAGTKRQRRCQQQEGEEWKAGPAPVGDGGRFRHSHEPHLVFGLT